MTNSDRGFIRDWAALNSAEALSQKNLTIDSLFAVFMHYVSLFDLDATTSPTSGGAPSKADKMLDMDAHSGDGALFEVGSYNLFKVDFWLFQKRPDHRGSITAEMTSRFIAVFSKAFDAKTEVIRDLHYERQDGYARIMREKGVIDGTLGSGGWDPNTVLFHFGELLLRSRGNEVPGHYAFEQAPLELHAIRKFLATAAIWTWEQHMVPCLIEAVRQHCDHIDGPTVIRCACGMNVRMPAEISGKALRCPSCKAVLRPRKTHGDGTPT